MHLYIHIYIHFSVQNIFLLVQDLEDSSQNISIKVNFNTANFMLIHSTIIGKTHTHTHTESLQVFAAT